MLLALKENKFQYKRAPQRASARFEHFYVERNVEILNSSLCAVFMFIFLKCYTNHCKFAHKHFISNIRFLKGLWLQWDIFKGTVLNYTSGTRAKFSAGKYTPRFYLFRNFITIFMIKLWRKFIYNECLLAFCGKKSLRKGQTCTERYTFWKIRRNPNLTRSTKGIYRVYAVNSCEHGIQKNSLTHFTNSSPQTNVYNTIRIWL